MAVQDVHRESLATSMALTRYYMPNAITPIDVITVLNSAGVRFMLVGLHGIGGWLHEPRATQDVDVVVATRGRKKAIHALEAAFSHLQAEDHEIVTRFRNPETQQVAIDVIKTNQPLFREALKHTHWVEAGSERYQIPSLEMALVMKFASMISLTRQEEDRYQDAHDFILLVKSNPVVDLHTLADLGDLVYPDGGREVVEKVADVRAGRKLNL